MLDTLSFSSDISSQFALQSVSVYFDQSTSDQEIKLKRTRNLKDPRSFTAFSSNSVIELLPIEMDPGWIVELARRTSKLTALKAGWDGIGSIPVDVILLNKATRLIREALIGIQVGKAPYLVPGGDGSVQIEWHEKSGELEYDLDSQGRTSIWIREHYTGEEIEGQDERALALFLRWAPRFASKDSNVVHVPHSANTSVYGTFAGASVYQDGSIS